MRILCTIWSETLVTVLMFMLGCDIARCSELEHNQVLYGPELSLDFEQFLRTLDKEVYGSKAKRQKNVENQEEPEYFSTLVPQSNKITKVNENKKIEDALMMKLVSYYENKFKLSRPEQLTTEMPGLDLTYITKPIPIENIPVYRRSFETNNLPAPVNTPHHPTVQATVQTTTPINEINHYDNLEYMFDYPEYNGFYEVILPKQ